MATNQTSPDAIREPANRERMFLNMFMTTTAWTILLMFSVIARSKTPIHGRKIQTTIEELTNGAIKIPNSVIYSGLEKMANEGFVSRHWEERDDPNKRHRRFYVLTPAGEDRFERMRYEVRDRVENYVKFSETVLTQGEKHFSNNPGEDMKANVWSLLRFWVLQVLSTPQHGLEIKRSVEHIFPMWEVSHGTLYPLLSELDTQGYIRSYWGNEQDEVQNRAVRYYEILPKGKTLKKKYGQLYLNHLRENLEKARHTLSLIST